MGIGELCARRAERSTRGLARTRLRQHGLLALATILAISGSSPALAAQRRASAEVLRGDPPGAGARFHTGGAAPQQQVEYPAGVERLHYRYGPILVAPGTNLILVGQKPPPKPEENGYLVGLVPNLTLPNGKVPATDLLHLHHGVWLSTAGADTTVPDLSYQRFFATGEEKTQMHLPAPYGYPVSAADKWILNYMIHNLTSRRYTVYIDYEVDFVPANTPLGQTMHPVRPIWMDVDNGSAYPVFDALRGAGRGGSYTYPDQDPGAYSGEAQRDEWTVDRPGTLVWAGGHLHPGGLYDTLELLRPGAKLADGGGAGAPIAGAEPDAVRLFRSSAHYWDPRGPISWDLAMSVTSPGWRVAIEPGDVLRVSGTYDTRAQSWYEVMGIMVLWEAVGDTSGVNPFTTALDTSGQVTHARLPENVDAGGAMSIGAPDPRRLRGVHAAHNTIDIKEFAYLAGGYGLPGAAGDPPTVKAGQSLRFVNLDDPQQVFHTITACRAPCMLSGGISYPLANGPATFDSGELGTGVRGFTAASGRIAWRTPANLAPGTYTYFCRIHPWMRGSFRVVKR